MIMVERVAYPRPVGTFESMIFRTSRLVGYSMLVSWRLIFNFRKKTTTTPKSQVVNRIAIWTAMNHHSPVYPGKFACIL